MSNKLHYDIEYADGSGGRFDFNTPEEAWAACKAACAANPGARVWYADEVVQQGFLASDERGGL